MPIFFTLLNCVLLLLAVLNCFLVSRFFSELGFAELDFAELGLAEFRNPTTPRISGFAQNSVKPSILPRICPEILGKLDYITRVMSRIVFIMINFFKPRRRVN